jgi:hypothetical protein
LTITASGQAWKPHVRAAVEEINGKFPGVSWGTYPGHHPSEPLATDGMIPKWDTNAGKAVGNALAYMVANVETARRLGIWYVIFNERIWSMSRPDSGWIQYRPTQAAIDRSPASAFHRNHVHISFYSGVPAAPVKPDYLPTYIVDPAKVSTFLYGHKDGEKPKERPPGYRIDTGVKLILRTEAGWEYDLSFLKLDDEGE